MTKNERRIVEINEEARKRGISYGKMSWARQSAKEEKNKKKKK